LKPPCGMNDAASALVLVNPERRDIHRFEINEAFAAQYLACGRKPGLDRGFGDSKVLRSNGCSE
jgi:hypothetical protein